MSEHKLTPEQMRTLTALTNKAKKSRAGQSDPLTEEEQAWRMEAIMAITEGRELTNPYLPQDLVEVEFKDKEVPGEVKKAEIERLNEGIIHDSMRDTIEESTRDAGLPPDEEFNQTTRMDAEVAADITEAEEEMSDEEIVEHVRTVLEATLKEEGLWEEYEAAKEKYGEVWVNSSNGVIFGIRKLKFKDIMEVGEIDSLMEEMKMVADRCVVVNKDALIGDDPSAYVYEMVYQLVRAISNARPDMPYSVKV